MGSCALLGPISAGCEIVGIEIKDSAVSVATRPFKGNTAFMLGNEVRGCTCLLTGGRDNTEYIRECQNTRTCSHPFSWLFACQPCGLQGQGLNDKQVRLCDSFVYIPQYGAGTASLNVAVATSIVLHEWAQWAGYPERERSGQKFIVDERPMNVRPKYTVPLSEEEMAVLQARRRGGSQQEGGSGSNSEQLAVDFWGEGLPDFEKVRREAAAEPQVT
jgi:hypothetical protein